MSTLTGVAPAPLLGSRQHLAPSLLPKALQRGTEAFALPCTRVLDVPKTGSAWPVLWAKRRRLHAQELTCME